MLTSFVRVVTISRVGEGGAFCVISKASIVVIWGGFKLRALSEMIHCSHHSDNVFDKFLTLYYCLFLCSYTDTIQCICKKPFEFLLVPIWLHGFLICRGFRVSIPTQWTLDGDALVMARCQVPDFQFRPRNAVSSLNNGANETPLIQ